MLSKRFETGLPCDAADECQDGVARRQKQKLMSGWSANKK
jgi:hypothetical protein